ncbi:hypothetical protein F4781DRAFT_429441 [Annulohypoxylon bovei var. microspora]|nr:hypothetical protein F4781DRAFT_429441 [Annulohypoxylon bovei var. microspora]
MSTSENDNCDCFPKHISNDAINKLLVSIGLPEATNIVIPEADASFHAIFMVSIPPNEKTTHDELVLRVADKHLPQIKTANEVGVMDENSLGYEYTLLSRVSGETLRSIWSKLDEKQIDGILDQLADFLAELHSYTWPEIGGIVVDAEGNTRMARVVDEIFRSVRQIRLWPAGETVESLNIGGPYKTYTDYISAQLNLYIRLVRLHDKLEFFRHRTSSLRTIISALKMCTEQLDKTRFILAHKNLHFGNIMYDKESGKITAILDWGFAGVVPAPKWDPVKAFLWNCESSEESKEAKKQLNERFARRCEERGVKVFLEEMEFTSPSQKAVQTLADRVRAIIEDTVRVESPGGS